LTLASLGIRTTRLEGTTGTTLRFVSVLVIFGVKEILPRAIECNAWIRDSIQDLPALAAFDFNVPIAIYQDHSWL